MASTIKSLAPRICPQCEAERSFTILADHIMCRRCGYTQTRGGKEPACPPAPKSESPRTGGRSLHDPHEPLRPRHRITHPGEVSMWARAAYETAQNYIHQQKWEAALKALYRALDSQRDFLDAHLCIALLVNDPVEKREHLEAILALDPNHLEAIRELLVLDGKLSPEATLDPYAEPEKREAGGAVATETLNLRCPQCGSPNLNTDEATGLVVCASCGYAQKSQTTATGKGLLTEALLERRSQPVQWVVGERMLACKSCGAQRTLPAHKLSERCPFCDSTHVIEQDVLGSFQQPDGLILFATSRIQAEEAIDAKLNSVTERVKGWFDRSRVKRVALEGAYLPFWAFDVAVEMRYTVEQTTYEPEHRGFQRPQYTQKTITKPGAMRDVLVCAVKSPSPLLTQQLRDYDLKRIVAYEASLLAEYPAQLYSMDFDKASLEARSIVGQRMRERFGESTYGYTHVKHMAFQLVLLPVWVATLYEEDGDIRSALVNGQTGQVVLGKARRPGGESLANG